MKKKIFIFLGILMFMVFAYQSFAQSPKAFNYQAVARDNSGNVMQNHAVSILIMLHIGSAIGSVVFQEQFLVTTNHFGLFTLAIGTGTNIFGSFDTIAWHKNQYWLQVAMDPDAGSSFSDMGTSKLLSVPYAMYAENTGALPGGTPGQTIRHDNTAWVADTNLYNDGSKVGIGTTSPDVKLHILGSTAGDSSWKQGILVENNNALGGKAAVSFKNHPTDTNYWFTGLNIDSNFSFNYGTSFTDACTKLRITTNGNVGIGTNNPISVLHVIGDIRIATQGNNGNGKVILNGYGGGTEAIEGNTINGVTITSGGIYRMRILTNGNVGIGTTVPTTKLQVDGTVTAPVFNETTERQMMYTGINGNGGMYHDMWNFPFNMAYNINPSAASSCYIPLIVREGETIGTITMIINIQSAPAPALTGDISIHLVKTSWNTNNYQDVASSTASLSTNPTSLAITCNYIVEHGKVLFLKVENTAIGGTGYVGLFPCVVTISH